MTRRDDDPGADRLDAALSVDVDRLRTDIEQTAAFGAVETDEPETYGRTNRTGSRANRQARDYLVDRLDEAGLSVTVDPVGNIAGTWVPDDADSGAAPIASGSHLDSVPEGGIFDGPLGVYAALEAVRTLEGADLSLERPVTVVCFTEEEGATFGDGLLGSSVATGATSVETAHALTDETARSLGDALSEIGYHGEGTIDPSTWEGFLELHVEQDTVLEETGADAGVVSTITGITHCAVTVLGEADHAGATAMNNRTDALAAAAELIQAVETAATDAADELESAAVGTVGSLSVSPNATNVIPGRVEARLDIRDVTTEGIERIVSAARSSLARLERDRGVETGFDRQLDVAPTPMSDRLREAAHAAAIDCGVDAIDLPSGAAHDTMRIADATEAALLFAPSRGGYSHSPKEWTDWTACARATEVLTGAIARAATDDPS